MSKNTKQKLTSKSASATAKFVSASNAAPPAAAASELLAPELVEQLSKTGAHILRCVCSSVETRRRSGLGSARQEVEDEGSQGQLRVCEIARHSCSAEARRAASSDQVAASQTAENGGSKGEEVAARRALVDTGVRSFAALLFLLIGAQAHANERRSPEALASDG